MKIIRVLLNAFLMMTIFGAAIFAQNDREILAEGNPPLTQKTADAVLKYYERGLALEFSESERGFLHDKLVESWEKAKKTGGKNLASFIRTVEIINSWDDAKIRRHQEEITETLLADLRNSPNNDFYKSVLSVYQNSNGNDSNVARQTENETSETAENSGNVETKPENQTTRENNFKPISGAIKVSDLAGKWSKGSVSSYGYRNTVTNDYRSAYGAANQHDIYASGAFDYTNFAQISSYGCTTELSTSMKGRASVSGSQVTFSYVSGTVKIDDSCKRSSVTKPAQIKKTTYRIERDGDKIRLCETGTDVTYCLYREN